MLLILVGLLVGLTPHSGVSAQTAAGELNENISKLSSLEFPVRMHAARLIRRAPETEAVPALVEAARRHPDEFVRYRALVLLTAFSARATGDVIPELMRDRNDRVREVAYKWLERHPDPRLTASLLASLQKEESEFVRPALVAALAALGAEPAVQRAMTGEVGRGLDFFRSAVIDALGRHQARYAVDAIVAASRLEGPLQDDALLALARIGGQHAQAALSEFTGGTAEAIQMMHAVRCLGGDACAGHIAALVSTVESEEARPRDVRAAIDALAAAVQARHEAALAALLGLATRQDEVRERIAVAFSTVALRQADWFVDRLATADEATRDLALGLLKDGFDSLDEDFEEEQFFAAVRSGYWRAAEKSPARTLASLLIQRLEF